MMLFRFFPLLALLATGTAFGCPQGMMVNPARASSPNTVGQPECIPNIQGGGTDSPYFDRVIWEKRWGAIAGDNASGKTGIVGSMSSKRKAEKGALAMCKAKGGANCQVKITYNNQCGVMAWGGGVMSTASAPTLEEASQLAIRECSKDAKGCEVYFSDCSFAERVR